MTLWQLAQSWGHSGHGWTILDGRGNDKTPPCHRCQLEQWAREKAKFWDDKIIAAQEMYPPAESNLIEGVVESMIDELGVPKPEDTNA